MDGFTLTPERKLQYALDENRRLRELCAGMLRIAYDQLPAIAVMPMLQTAEQLSVELPADYVARLEECK